MLWICGVLVDISIFRRLTPLLGASRLSVFCQKQHNSLHTQPILTLFLFGKGDRTSLASLKEARYGIMKVGTFI